MKKIDDWSSMMTAQHKAALYQESQEKLYNKLNKQKFREELDNQLRVKQKLNKSNEDFKKQEFSYHQEQVRKFLDFDNQAKKEKREFIKIYEQENLAAASKKIIESKRLKQAEKISVSKEIENEKCKLNKESFFTEEKKREIINSQRLEIEKHVQENKAKERLAEIEKLREKQLLDKRDLDLQKTENQHQEFMQKKIRVFNERMREISKSFVYSDPKENLIQKRQAEYDELVRSKEIEKEGYEKSKKIESVRSFRKGLDDQIRSKMLAKKEEQELGRRYQEVFKKEAYEDEYYKKLRRFTKNLEKKRIKEEYDKQVLDKRSNSCMKFAMNNREKELNSRVLEKGNFVFPSVPGLQCSDSPAKLSFDRIYSKQVAKREAQRGSVNIRKSDVYWTECDTHNPITNPNGGKVQRLGPGERAGKVFRSDPRFRIR